MMGLGVGNIDNNIELCEALDEITNDSERVKLIEFGGDGSFIIRYD